MSTLKAVFLDYDTMGPDVDCSALEQRASVEYYPVTAPDDVLQRLHQADIAITNKTVLDKETLSLLPDLKLVLVVATGTDVVALEQARAQQVAVYNIRDYCTASVVQHVWGLILALTHDLAGYRESVVRGDWSAAEQFCLFDQRIRELHGRRLGIVGLGTLGGAVARVGEAFGMQVVAAALPGRDGSGDRLPIDALMERSDVVSLHCPLTPETDGLVGADQLAALGPEGLLINTARGGLVDSAALAEALRNGALGGAGIDVLEREPPPRDHPLLAADIPRLIVTPHTAWSALEARERAIQQTAENIDNFLSGTEGRRVV